MVRDKFGVSLSILKVIQGSDVVQNPDRARWVLSLTCPEAI